MVAGPPTKAPEYVTPDPRIQGVAKVYRDPDKTSEGDDYYVVDLANWTCECKHGAPYFWFAQKEMWLVRRPCTHKVRAFADCVESHGAPDDLTWLYIRSLSTRYNAFEVVSAFHKELRRGDFPRAYFWGMMLAAHRSGKGVIKYMLNIIYEETRDHDLANHLLDLVEAKTSDMHSIGRAIKWFCLSPKKWFLPHRPEIFFAEMRGYNSLCDRFGNDVARAGDIIPYMQNRDELVAAMRAPNDPAHFQFGVKGLQKCADVDIQELRHWMVNDLANRGEADGIEGVSELLTYIERKRRLTKDIGYHDVNALADLVGHREPYRAGLISATLKMALLRRKHRFKFPFARVPSIPLYAHDNHTWGGKAKLRQFPAQIAPEAVQTDLDLRWCGAYYGVAYRTISVIQHGRIADWHEVPWPDWLHRVVSRLWY